MSLFRNDGRGFEQLRADFRWTVPRRFNIADAVCDRHRDRRDEVALYLENGAGRTRRVTLGELKALSDRFANALRGLGVGVGDRVAIILPQRLETVVAHLAVYKLAGIALPLSVLFGPDAIGYRLSDSGARIAVADRGHAEMLADLHSELEQLAHVIDCDDDEAAMGFWNVLERGAERFEPVPTGAHDPALLIYTSGTTGPPKGALNAHRCLLGTLPGFELSHDFFPRPRDLMYTPADWAWTGGLLDGLLPALYYGVPVVGFDGGKFDPERTCDLLQRYRVRNAFIPPTAMKMLMQVPRIRSRFDLRLRSIMSAGEQVGAEVLSWAQDTLGVALNEMWGQTEFNYLAGGSAAIMEPRPGAMGKAYPGHRVDVIDEAGQPLPDDAVGDLAAWRHDDPVMFLGYWRSDAATREKFVGDWWLTGDQGYRDADGYLWFVGRKDDVISSAGHRIGPGEIEDCLLKHPAVAQAAVIGSPDPLRGQIVKAFVVRAPGHSPSPDLIADIQSSVRTRLAAHEYPREVEFVDELPMTTTGKVRRVELRQREHEAKSSPADEA